MPEPKRPSITPAQIVAVLIAGVPAVAKLLEAFGAYTLTAAQQDALTGALTWLGVLAGVLIASDAALRSARNAAHAKVATKPPAPFSFTTKTGEGFSSATVKPLRRIDEAATLGQPEDTSLEVPGGGVLPDGTRA